MAESIAVMDKKTITITGKRQITIPQKFLKRLGLEEKRSASCAITKS